MRKRRFACAIIAMWLKRMACGARTSSGTITDARTLAVLREVRRAAFHTPGLIQQIFGEHRQAWRAASDRPGWREGGKNTASGERYDLAAWTAAIKTSLREKFGGVRFDKDYRPVYALVESADKQVIVKINDVGP